MARSKLDQPTSLFQRRANENTPRWEWLSPLGNEKSLWKILDKSINFQVFQTTRMKLRHLLLFTIVGLVLADIVYSEPSVDDDEEEDDDGQVEVEEEYSVIQEPPREKPKYKRPVPKAPVFFHEPFHSKEDFVKRWVLSQAKKDGADESIAKYDGKWEVEEPKQNPIQGDLGLVLKSKAKHHAVATYLERPYEFKGRPLIAQYEVRFQNGLDCGGAYVKLLSRESKFDLKTFQDKTPYTIMFGPDKCGTESKIHFIFRHKNPKTGEIEEKHAKKPSANVESYFTDKKTHLYKLVVNPDNTFEIYIDDGLVNKGSLLEDVSPPVNPPKEIEDSNDKKPADWDDREKIPDPDAVKPDDWDENEPATITDPDAVKPEDWLEDEPSLLPDPEATKPADWDEEMDGEWEAPLTANPKCKEVSGCGEWTPPTIPNPKYRGKWKAPMIDNPNYKGVWKPRMIENPAYFEDKEPYKMTPIGAIGLELWSMTDEIVFDNFLITDDLEISKAFTADTWDIKSYEERAATSAGGIWQTLMTAAQEHPWLWAVYVVVLLLPIILLSICLCPKAGPIKQEDIDAERKKTDEASPDEEKEKEEGKEDEENKEEEEENTKDGVGAGDTGETKKATKADLNAPENEDDGEEADAEEDEDAKGSPKKTSPRRRRLRKE
ncbi:LOW QUALITY PROTEIN: calnexin-like [Pomacea canaliculata]|uniref:LOW QUALITY PROTEIN: calnexin-like n=1 Tax=Pomacea canaliculata TaxID=400727 RepID=UPI000D733B35|nr:LOW QUALITY PROTEIN: calnexin-like [Pomacea canaliculata]